MIQFRFLFYIAHKFNKFLRFIIFFTTVSFITNIKISRTGKYTVNRSAVI